MRTTILHQNTRLGLLSASLDSPPPYGFILLYCLPGHGWLMEPFAINSRAFNVHFERISSDALSAGLSERTCNTRRYTLYYIIIYVPRYNVLFHNAPKVNTPSVTATCAYFRYGILYIIFNWHERGTQVLVIIILSQDNFFLLIFRDFSIYSKRKNGFKITLFSAHRF